MIDSHCISLQTLEQGVFDKVAEYLTLMGRTELLTCLATQSSYGKIRDQAQQVRMKFLKKNNYAFNLLLLSHWISLLQLTREYNIMCCYLHYPVLKQHIQYDYERCDNDKITQ